MKQLGALLLLFIGLVHSAIAMTYSLPPTDAAIIGDMQYASAQPDETLPNLAKRYNLGLNELTEANPNINPSVLNLPQGTLAIPTQHLLPPVARKGIVINLPEMRMYYYPNNAEVMTFPIGIGRIGKTIPIQNTSITRKVVNPTWTPTPAIRAYNKEQGIDLPARMGPGPDNPLGPYAIYMQIPTYLIHSTIFPESIGRRASFGCIRMNETDIKDLFPLVNAGVPVTILNMPTKIAWEGDTLYLETHAPLEERRTEANATLDGMVTEVQRATHGKLTLVDWQLLAYLSENRDGIPHEIGMQIK